MGSLLTICIAGAALMGALYSFFPLGESSTEEYLSLWKMNAADLRVWWRHDFGTTLMRDASLVPTAIPNANFMVCNSNDHLGITSLSSLGTRRAVDAQSLFGTQ